MLTNGAPTQTNLLVAFISYYLKHSDAGYWILDKSKNSSIQSPATSIQYLFIYGIMFNKKTKPKI